MSAVHSDGATESLAKAIGVALLRLLRLVGNCYPSVHCRPALHRTMIAYVGELMTKGVRDSLANPTRFTLNLEVEIGGSAYNY